MSRRLPTINRGWKLTPLVALTVVVVSTACSPPDKAEGIAGGTEPHWVATWAAAMYDSGPLSTAPFFAGIENRTVRNIVRVSTGGRAVRLRLSNLLGTLPVTFDAVHVGIREHGAAVAAGTDYAVTFDGLSSITINAGGQALSDQVNLGVEAGQDLAVSLYSVHETGLVTMHQRGGQTNYISDTGNFAGATGAETFTTESPSWYFLRAVDVLAPPDVRGAVVALGDSTTIGAASTVDENRRWTDVVARRLVAEGVVPAVSMVNVAISGNRVLSSSPCFGVSAEERLQRDVFGQAGVLAVFLFEGTNDLGHPDGMATATEQVRPCVNAPHVTAEQMVAAYQRIITQVHARGLLAIGGTILPYGGHRVWNPESEAKRKAINEWILTSGSFDATVDFAAALADTRDPTRMLPEFDSGDHLHPSDAGYEAMGNVVDLKLFSSIQGRRLESNR